MRIADMNWMQVGDQLARDDRCVLPIGSVEQHGYLSLATDAMLAERVACEAAAPLQVPVFPVLNYGFTPYFTGYPGTVSLGLATYLALVRDVITGIHRQGFRRIVVVNGHGGNAPAAGVLNELMQEQPDLQLKFHNWWNAPRTQAFVKSLEPESSHASWMENLPWTRIAGVEFPAVRKAAVDSAKFHLLDPSRGRELAGDGNFGGSYVRPDGDVLRMWELGVEETRAVIEGPWREQR
jgi:creatinine amidohydrolase